MNIGLGEIHFAGLHVVDCRNYRVRGRLIEVLHVFLVLSVVQGARIHTDGVLEGIFEENLVEVAVETESIDSAVLMESGDVYADDILVLYESCDSASDLADVFCRKSICVKNRVNNDSVIRAVAHREYSDSEVVEHLGGVFGVGIGEASADIVVAVKLVASEKRCARITDIPAGAVRGFVIERLAADI